jgi:hypothetical protein
MRDSISRSDPKLALAPAVVSDNTAQVGPIIDLQGADACAIFIAMGTIVDADATFAVTLEHGDAANLADTSAPATTDLVGTLALASFTFAEDLKTRKLGYIGGKRYIRLTITPSLNASAAPMAAIAVLSKLHVQPASNPPT